MIDVPVPADAPPHEAVYQCQDVPDESVPVTDITEEAPPQILAGNGFTVVAEDGIGITTTPTLLQFE